MKVFFSSWLYLLSSSHSKGSILTGLDSIAAESIAGDSRTVRRVTADSLADSSSINIAFCKSY